jgi:hypothetical protein
MAAASRAAARESERRAKYYAKQQMISEAADAVEEWELHIEKLTTVNTVIDLPMDWKSAASQPGPDKPIQAGGHRKLAQKKLDDFHPGFWDFFYGGSKRRRDALERALLEASALDQKEFATLTAAYEQAHADWVSDVALATRVLALEPGSFKEVIEEAIDSFKENLFAKSIEFNFGDTFLHVIPTVFPASIVPKVRRKQLASGRLSESDMPAAQGHLIYQDYVAGVALGVANSVLRLLPVAEVYVTCRSEMLNKQTGHLEVLPILSVKFVRSTLDNLNLLSIDASDALQNFNHVMAFKRASGFSPITPMTDTLN